MSDLIPTPSHQKSLVGKLNDAAGYCVRYIVYNCFRSFRRSYGDSPYFPLAVSERRCLDR